MEFDPEIPFDQLPDLPPQATLETRPVLKQCLNATRALAELKGAGGLIPDQSILINAIPLQEAQASSEIENIVTTQDELFRATLDETAVTDPATKEVLRYRSALRHGYESLKNNPLSMGLLLKVGRILRDAPELEFRAAGEFVAIGNPDTREIIYTPPGGGMVLSQKLQNLEAFLLEENGLDPLIKMATSHYQFEAIHPFTDGNGRTGRILNLLYLLHSGLLDIPVLYLSRFIIQNKTEYYMLLRKVTEEGDWERWILFMLRGIEETALWTTSRIRAIRELLEETVAHCRQEAPKVYSRDLMDIIFRQPYCKISFVVDAGIAKRQTASVHLQELARIGILTSEKVGREWVFRNPALLELLSV